MIGSDLKHSVCLTLGQYAVYQTLVYFQIFSYPLTKSEIAEVFMGAPPQDLDTCLNDLQSLELIFETAGYYSLDTCVSQQIQKRNNSEKRFQEKLGKMRRYAKFISRFPFVRFVGITGSCAKGLFEKEGDVDYFIVTEPGRLWICRTLLVLFKKVFLLNSHRYFCLNYFVDSNSLKIPDENIYAAHEILAMAPVNNPVLHQRFRDENEWTENFFPAWKSTNTSFANKDKGGFLIAKIVEVLLSGFIGSALDNFCFRFTLTFWRKRFNYLEKEDFDLRFRSYKHVSKHHPRGYQQRVLAHLNSKLVNIEMMEL